MSKTEDLATLDAEIAHCKRVIEESDRLERLDKNPDFKILFLEKYIKDEAVRLVSLKASSAMQDPKQQLVLDHQLFAIAYFNQHLIFMRAANTNAKAALEVNLAEREALLQEGEEEV